MTWNSTYSEFTQNHSSSVFFWRRNQLLLLCSANSNVHSVDSYGVDLKVQIHVIVICGVHICQQSTCMARIQKLPFWYECPMLWGYSFSRSEWELLITRRSALWDTSLMQGKLNSKEIRTNKLQEVAGFVCDKFSVTEALQWLGYKTCSVHVVCLDP